MKTIVNKCDKVTGLTDGILYTMSFVICKSYVTMRIRIL